MGLCGFAQRVNRGDRYANLPFDKSPIEPGEGLRLGHRVVTLHTQPLARERCRLYPIWMHEAPARTHEIQGAFEFFAAGALTIRHHHERLDGSGYPDGLAGEAIPIGARIVAVADVYDALTSDRPYRTALPREAALEYLMRQAGRTLDGRAVAALVELARENPSANLHVGALPALAARHAATPR